MLADPKTPPATRDQLERGISVIDHPERIRPNHVVPEIGADAHRRPALDVHLAKFRRDRRRRLDLRSEDPRAIVGDLVVGLVPFMDTACADGWSQALDEIARSRSRP